MKTKLKLVLHPVKSLHQLSEPVLKFDQELKELAAEMGQAMYDFEGVGLAAPQIGKNIRLIAVTDGQSGYKIYVNPEITFRSKDKVDMSEEGCLSVPGVFGFVPRAYKIRLRYQDLDGKKHKAKAKGMEAIILQHEVDHLQGTLFIDKVAKIFEGQEILDKMERARQA